jgi:type I restriction enzyme M protein
MDLTNRINALKKQLKDGEAALDALAYARYPQLTPNEIQSLVIDGKWMAALSASVQGELDRVSQTLTGRLRELAERYAAPLPQLAGEVEMLAAKVAGHLAAMGVAWK